MIEAAFADRVVTDPEDAIIKKIRGETES